jgi:hypothetical protein
VADPASGGDPYRYDGDDRPGLEAIRGRIDQLLSLLADPNLPRVERRRITRSLRQAQRIARQIAREEFRRQRLEEREETRRQRIESGTPFLEEQVERLQAANRELKEYAGISTGLPGGAELGPLDGGFMSAAGLSEGASSLLGGAALVDADGNRVDDADLTGVEPAGARGGLFGLPLPVLLGGGALLVWLLLRRKRGRR